jgi:hypothetical protein
MLIPSPTANASHFGGQLIPLPPPGQNGWALTDLTHTDTQFIGRSVPLPAGSSRLLGQAPLERTLDFSAVPPPTGATNVFYLVRTNDSFGPVAIAGEFFEILASPVPGSLSLQFTNRGVFFLAREAPILTSLEIPTSPAVP